MIYYIRHEQFSKSFSSLLNALETVNQAEINMSSKMGDSLFKLGRYNRVFLETWAQIPIWVPILKEWAVGSFFLAKILQKSSQGPTKVHFFHKNKHVWEMVIHDDLEWPILSYYVIYCEKFRKVLQRTEKVALNCLTCLRYIFHTKNFGQYSIPRVHGCEPVNGALIVLSSNQLNIATFVHQMADVCF